MYDTRGNPTGREIGDVDPFGDVVSALARRVLASTPSCGPVRLLAIDGGAASGKTTLAGACAAAVPGAALLHTDDLLDGWSDQFTFWPRLHEEVLAPLADGRAAVHRTYDWVVGRFTSEVELGVPDVLVVEGVSAIAACGRFASVRVLLDVPRAERERRWIARDGALSTEARQWLDNEDRFFAEWLAPADVVRLRW